MTKGAVTASRLLATATISVMLGCGSRQSLEQQVLSADHLEYLAEAFPSDGGSRVFFFYMHPPKHQLLALMVRHRNPALGGNADFQEIWLDRGGGFGTHTDVQPASALEAKLLLLLQAATIGTNAELHVTTKPASLDHLKWVTERMTDRRAKW